jgi:hypothetical protein
MSTTLESEPLEQPFDGAPRGRTVKLLVGGVLTFGAVAGLVLNHTAAAGRTVNAASVAVIPPAAQPAPAATPVAGRGQKVQAAAPAAPEAVVRMAQLVAPEDPFRPSAAPAAPIRFAAPPAARPFPAHLVLPPAGQAAAPAASGAEKSAAAAAPQPTERTSAPSPDEFAVTGIIQGDPPLAVVRYAGTSLFLKIGDQVADTWRLVEINERSVRFQLGEQRVEVPIKGGSSE